MHKFQFDRKVDILGLWGTTSLDPNETIEEKESSSGMQGEMAALENQDDDEGDREDDTPLQKEYIHTLGFITNECPSRNVLEFEKNLNVDKTTLKSLEDTIKYEVEHEDPVIGVVIVTVLCISICFCWGYYCLKNRGQICKRSGYKD